MNPFMNPESAFLTQEEIEEDQESVKNLKDFLRQTAERLRGEGVPVRHNCRIEMDEFRDIYSVQEIEKDKQEVARIESQISFNETMSDQRLGERKC